MGGKNSGNTRRLYEICADACANTHHIEDVEELDGSWVHDAVKIGVTAGASTPQAHIDGVVARLRELSR